MIGDNYVQIGGRVIYDASSSTGLEQHVSTRMAGRSHCSYIDGFDLAKVILGLLAYISWASKGAKGKSALLILYQENERFVDFFWLCGYVQQ